MKRGRDNNCRSGSSLCFTADGVPVLSENLRFRIGIGPSSEGLHEALQEFAGSFVGKLTVYIEKLVCPANISLRLLHRRNVEKDERLSQMVIRPEASDCTW